MNDDALTLHERHLNGWTPKRRERHRIREEAIARYRFDPTPEEIAARAAEIRATWDERERILRSTGIVPKPVEVVEYNFEEVVQGAL